MTVNDFLTKLLPVSVGSVLYHKRGKGCATEGVHTPTAQLFLCEFLFACRVAEKKSNNNHTVWKLVKQTDKNNESWGLLQSD